VTAEVVGDVGRQARSQPGDAGVHLLYGAGLRPAAVGEPEADEQVSVRVIGANAAIEQQDRLVR